MYVISQEVLFACIVIIFYRAQLAKENTDLKKVIDELTM